MVEHLANRLSATAMTCRDRTQEFMATCKSMQSRQQQNGIQPNPTGATRQRTEFTLIAKRIGKDLSSTFTKLEKLTLLAKRKSLFDDKAADIEELTYIIKKDINSLNKQIAQLQEFVRGRGAQSSRHVQTHSNTVVVSLQSRLASMSNTFKNVLEVRTENLKEQRSRREHFTQSTISSLPPPIMNGHGRHMHFLAFSSHVHSTEHLLVEFDFEKQGSHRKTELNSLRFVSH
uniref:Syntaxin 5A n=1 Tax=Eptatretus burgeri TaxID=7764 RepID=A0A8C4QER8_EPTBU